MAEYVSKEAVLPRMEELIGAVLDLLEIDSLDSENEEAELKNTAVELCNAIPAADVRPERHERWVWNPNGMDWNLGAFVCSACNCKNDNLPDNRFNPYMYAGSNYCPNCGAKMDGKDGESNG